ncbi:MAG: hypothetical protein ACXWG9_15335 [Usitatibacter sp.]
MAALAVAGLAVTGEVQAQSRGSHGGAIHGGGAPHWGGTNWGHGRSWSRGYWSGPRVGLYIGAPLLLGAWGWPYYYGYDWDYPRSTVIYREVERYPQPYGEEPGELLPSTQIPPGEGAPTQGPLYMNYCESAKAYFPKVTTCPEGWRLATPAR